MPGYWQLDDGKTRMMSAGQHDPGDRVNFFWRMFGGDYRFITVMDDRHVMLTPAWDEILAAGACLGDLPGMSRPEPDGIQDCVTMAAPVVDALGWVCEPSLPYRQARKAWSAVGAAANCMHTFSSQAIQRRVIPLLGEALPAKDGDDSQEEFAVWAASRRASDAARVSLLRAKLMASN